MLKRESSIAGRVGVIVPQPATRSAAGSSAAASRHCARRRNEKQVVIHHPRGPWFIARASTVSTAGACSGTPDGRRDALRATIQTRRMMERRTLEATARTAAVVAADSLFGTRSVTVHSASAARESTCAGHCIRRSVLESGWAIAMRSGVSVQSPQSACSCTDRWDSPETGRARQSSKDAVSTATCPLTPRQSTRLCVSPRPSASWTAATTSVTRLWVRRRVIDSSSSLGGPRKILEHCTSWM